MLERENAFYAAHQADLQKKYPDKWLIIVGEELFGAFDTIKDAFIAAQERFGDQEFMLHRPSDDGTIIEIGPPIPETYSDDDWEPESTMTVSSGKLVTFTYA